jgi:hypothetical protein
LYGLRLLVKLKTTKNIGNPEFVLKDKIKEKKTVPDDDIDFSSPSDFPRIHLNATP